MIASTPQSENGTVYFGDGNLGAIPSKKCNILDDNPIFVKKGTENNIWI